MKIKNIFLLIILFLFVNIINVSADDYSNISLNKLKEIKDNQSLLETVEYITITHEDDLSLVNLLVKCKNLKQLTISRATIDDLTFINDIKPNNSFELWIMSGYYDMDGLENEYVNSLWIDASYVSHFSNGMNFSNLKYLRIYAVDGYEDIDYSYYTKLESLAFDCISISDYKKFFEQLKNLKQLTTLSLSNCDITDSDTKYLEQINWLKDLNLECTHISDISFLENMDVEILSLPLNVEDLSIIKSIKNLKAIYWIGYEQLALTDDLVSFLDSHNIQHLKYDKNLKNNLLNMISQIKINDDMSIKQKIEAVMNYVLDWCESHDVFYDEEYSSNLLLYTTHYKVGLCSQLSILEHALLKLIGIDSYYIGGLAQLMSIESTGDYSYYTHKYDIAAHAWLMVKDERGIWYSWDPVNIDQLDRQEGIDMYFWKKPYEDDNYSFEDYRNGKYDIFNYNFAKRRIPTNKIGYDDYLTQKNEKNLIDILKNNGFSVNNGFVSKFTLGEDIEKIKNKLGNDIIIDSKTKIISTGAIIKKGDENYSVVIKGDLTGDGKINSGDLLQMRKHLLEDITLTGAYKQAGIIESNNEIKSLDLLRLRQYLLGEYVFK